MRVGKCFWRRQMPPFFFQAGKEKSLFKRADHMIFEKRQGNQWKLHLIEMKGSVGQEKWVEIKGKFRASYLVAQAIAGMLELDISETVMYTTYEWNLPILIPCLQPGMDGWGFHRSGWKRSGREIGLD